MHLSAIDRVLWATGFLAEAGLLLVLLIRGRAKSFPVFTALSALWVIRTIVLASIFKAVSRVTYYDTFWCMAASDMLLQLGVVYEIASHVFAPLGNWAADFRKSFIRILGASVAVALLLTALASPPGRSPLQSVIDRGTFFSSAIMTELFVGMVALSAVAGLPWRTHVARIAQGMGAYSLIGVLFDTTSRWFGWQEQGGIIHALTQIRIVAFLAAVTYWIVTLWQNAPEPRELTKSMRVQIFRLQRQVEYDLGRIRGWRKF